MKILVRTLLTVILSAGLIPAPSFAISAAARSAIDYRFSLETLRNIQIMVLNFPDEALKGKYDAIQKKFAEASEAYYGNNHVDSAEKFKKLKIDMIDLTEGIAKLYLTRTKDILDSTSKESFDIMIKYSKQSGMLTYFRRPFDPLYDIKPYNEKNYHLYHDRERIEMLLRAGYQKYNQAKKMFEDPEITYLKNRKKITHSNIDYIISNNISVVNLCRESKQNGIEIHHIDITIHPDSGVKKRLTPHAQAQVIKPDPIFDARIPEKYMVDANDNVKLVHEHEVKKRGDTPLKR